MLVIDRFILANKGVSILNKFLISNWSRGLIIVSYLNICKYLCFTTSIRKFIQLFFV